MRRLRAWHCIVCGEIGRAPARAKNARTQGVNVAKERFVWRCSWEDPWHGCWHPDFEGFCHAASRKPHATEALANRAADNHTKKNRGHGNVQVRKLEVGERWKGR